MEIIHVSAECYPMAKVGGLGDVVGALPKYLNKAGHIAKVVMPMYKTQYLFDNYFEVVHKGQAAMGSNGFEYTVIKEKTNKLGFDLYLVDIYGLLDREKVYGYNDDTERFTAFQIAVVDWISKWQHRPDVVHVHDHHTGLIPFMMKHCYQYRHLAGVPTVCTIHNAQYQGWMGWDKSNYIPAWDSWKWGELDWANSINPLASAIKCAWKVTTVSWSYLHELKWQSNGLEKLFEMEQGKCIGILNGIDTEVWNPATDKYIDHHFSVKNVTNGKQANKKELCNTFKLDIEKPLFVFIGRLVAEKAADLLPAAISTSFYRYKGAINFLILGSGDPDVENQLNAMVSRFPGNYNVYVGYNEKLSHLIYAGADFLLMPSRVEPCGLNQMYSLRYGTLPIVRSTGGLQDTVVDMGEWEGYGIRFNHASVDDIVYSIGRAIEAYKDKTHFDWMRKHMMAIDNSWEKATGEYVKVYEEVNSWK
jgi:starch synthase